MPDKVTTHTQARQILAMTAVLVFLVVAAACSRTHTISAPQTQQQQQAQASPQAQNTLPPRPAKVELNNEDLGTTADLAGFTKFLKGVLKRRDEQYVIKPGTDEIEKTVFVNPERSLKLGEVIKVFKAVEEAGASPLKLPVEVKGKKQEESAPSSLMLRVDIGNPEVIGNRSEGIQLWSRNTPPLDRDEKNHLIGHEVAVEIPRDGEYIVNGKLVGKSALVSALQARLKEAEVVSKTVSIIVEDTSQISYASLAAVAQAAFEAQAERIDLRTFGP